MNDAALTGVALAILALLALAVAAGVGSRRLAILLVVPVCAAAAVLVLAWLAAGAAPAALVLPVGLSAAGTALAIDGLSGLFLLLLFLAGAAIAAGALDGIAEHAATAPLLPVVLAAAAAALLAADAAALVLVLGGAVLAGGGLLLADHHEPDLRTTAPVQLGMVLAGIACLAGALGLLASGGDLRFAALRAHPPEAGRAALVLLLTLAGGLSLASVARPAALAAAPGPAGALLAGPLVAMLLYVAIRVLFDLCGTPQPLWWGAPLVGLGAVVAVLGGWCATQAADLKSVLAWAAIGQAGLVLLALGVALAARAVDAAPVAALALGGALLLAVASALHAALLFLVAGAVQRGAGSRRLDRLGGLIMRMKLTTGCALLGAAGLAALPPLAGFAGTWTLMQALLAGPRLGVPGVPVPAALAAAALGLATALTATAAVRLVGIAFLGRPRSPRAAAAAEEAAPPLRWAMLGLAGLALVVGLAPGAVLRLAGPALRMLTGTGLADRAGLLALSPVADFPGYAAPGIALLLALAGGLVVLAVRAMAVPGHREAPAWDNGADPPPAWLPFGDPATQASAAGFARTLRRDLGPPRLPTPSGAWIAMTQPASIRSALVGLFATLALVLLGLAL